MRMHVQGIGILALVLAALWGLTQLAAPALRGDGSAVTAQSREDRVDLTVGEEPADDPLTGDEVVDLQFGLYVEGFLDSADDVDGILGPGTRAAMDEAAVRWDMAGATDRELLDHVSALLAANPFFSSPGDG